MDTTSLEHVRCVAFQQPTTLTSTGSGTGLPNWGLEVARTMQWLTDLKHDTDPCIRCRRICWLFSGLAPKRSGI